MLCLSAHGQNATNTSAENSLETARRDLRALPATERSPELLGKSSGFGAAGLPTLDIPGEGNKPSSQPLPNATPSPTWLLDAMQQTELEQNQRRTATPRDPTATRESSSGYKPAAAPDPFGKYLEQWLSPRDLELLRPESRKNDAQKSTFGGETQTRSRLGTFGTATAPLVTDPVPILPTAQNPYLVESNSPSPAPLPGPFAPETTPALQKNERNRTPSVLPASAVTSSPKPAAPLKPAAKSVDASPKAPTAPIVDDRKYFPQLRRF